jgi:hypothetical protein
MGERLVPKFARPKRQANVAAPVSSSTDTPDALTAEGGAGFTRDPKSELFLLAVTNMVAEDSFYEGARDRDRRFAQLIHTVALDDPAWVARFVPVLRDRMHLRSASVVMAAEYAKARQATADPDGMAAPTSRSVVASALARADEPAEMLAYWHQTHGRRLPQAVKRGVADAVARLYTERAALKYDGDTRGYRMGDVIELVHPEPTGERQSAVFHYLLDRRHGREDIVADPALLPVVAARQALEAIPVAERRALLGEADVQERFRAAGVTWEWLSGWLDGPMDGTAWDAVIPSMGYMALLRNLRNFDEAGIPAATRDRIAAKLADPAEIASSRQLPLRFYAAYQATRSLSYAATLETALTSSLANVPAFAGRTLVLLDVSGSMASPMSGRGTGQRWELAALFGSAVALRAEHADLVAFQTTSQAIDFRKGGSVLRLIESIKPLVGGGTKTFEALQAHYRKHDRVVILTDEQAFPQGQLNASQGWRSWLGTPAQSIDVPIYTFNLAGYKVGHLPSGSHNRYTFGGLSDLAFSVLQILEQRKEVGWDDLFLSPASPGAADDASSID